MKHLGDITKIKGCDAPVVDCIIGGSPCQDLSVAGKRAGLAGERSGLYMEQIRIIKEMRHKDEQCGRTGESIRPRYMVWENVPGAFSSNQGKDFAAVLEEAIKVADPEAPNVPVPEKGWPTSGCIMGDNWSVAWRVLDAQFWGVPQRRRRIALVADFGGQSAPEILFIRKGVSRDIDESQQTREATARDAENRSGADDRDGSGTQCVVFNGSNITSPINKTNPQFGDPCHTLTDDNRNWLIQPVIGIDQQGGKGGANYSVNVSPPILSDSHGTPHAVAYALEPGIAAREGSHIYEGVSGTLRANAGDNQMAVCYNIGSYHSNAWKSDNPHSGVYEADKSKTLDALQCGYPGCNQGGMAVVQPSYCIGNGQVNDACQPDKELCKTLNCMDDPMKIMQPVCTYQDKIGSLCARDYKGVDSQYVNEDKLVVEADRVRVRYIVRRLTPLECERLQGYPDGWTDIGEWVDSKDKKHKEADAPRYKALGNSIALPPWKWVLKRLCACYERDATMASLFDGIGGFPYIWEQLNGKGSCLWASEIEEFPIAVTKLRFGGNE